MSPSWESKISDMHSYRFTVHKDDGTESLGFMALAGDAERAGLYATPQG
jgi:hypothetical protein